MKRYRKRVKTPNRVANPIPYTLRTNLKYNQIVYTQFLNGTGPLYFTRTVQLNFCGNPMKEFDDHQPSGYDIWKNIYSKCVTTGCKVRWKFSQKNNQNPGALYYTGSVITRKDTPPAYVSLQAFLEDATVSKTIMANQQDSVKKNYYRTWSLRKSAPKADIFTDPYQEWVGDIAPTAPEKIWYCHIYLFSVETPPTVNMEFTWFIDVYFRSIWHDKTRIVYEN